MARYAGPLLIALAALCWASDSLFRYPLIRDFNHLDPTVVVFCEHVVGILVLLPYLLLTHRRALTRLRGSEWLGVALIGAGGSALASILFTASFRYLNPSVTILLQKLQPILVVFISIVFLGERPGRKFYAWASVALAAAATLSFPDLKFTGAIDLHSLGVIDALSAAALWAICTVVGKAVLRKQPAPVLAFWRFAFGWGMLAVLLLASSTPLPLATLARPEVSRALLFMGLIPGVASMLAYYFGLARTPASVATFIELLFPIIAITVNAVFLHTLLSAVQMAAGAVLVVAVMAVMLTSATKGAKG